MNFLCIIPPYIPSYFNAGHHLPIFLVGNYLRKNIPQAEVTCIDAAVLNYTWKEVCDLLVKRYDVIVIFNDFDGIDTFERFMYYKKELSPDSRVITFGRLSKQIPHFFKQFNIDAIVASGDFESAVFNYIMWTIDPSHELSGVLLKDRDEAPLGKMLPPDKWVLPDVNEIPYSAYNFMYKNDLNKFCGIPERQELVVPIARGCPVGCEFCDVPPMQGKLERRLSVESTLNYIDCAFKQKPFEYISFYAPTFTLNRRWVVDFCNKLITQQKEYRWKCVTVLKMLDQELIELMAKSGCIRISLGIETFTDNSFNNLPPAKRDMKEKFQEIADFCQLNGIELNCFIILGFPGDSPEDVKKTIDLCRKHAARVRPTIYTPYHLLKNEMTVSEVNAFNRQLFVTGSINHEHKEAYYHLFYKNNEDKATQVMKKIPSKIQLQDMVND